MTPQWGSPILAGFFMAHGTFTGEIRAGWQDRPANTCDEGSCWYKTNCRGGSGSKRSALFPQDPVLSGAFF
jgi:hypothetical protein